MASSKKAKKQQKDTNSSNHRRGSTRTPSPRNAKNQVVRTTDNRATLKPDQDPPASAAPATPSQEAQINEPEAASPQPFVVGIGASAGGLEAFEQFFRNMPVDSGMVFVLIPHLDPQHTTYLPELIERFTSMPVHLVGDRIKVKPNHIYIIPPDCLMGIMYGKLYLVRRINAPVGGPSTINYFMRTLAEDQGERAVCIIFSGMGNDGAQAIETVKHELGLVLAQDPATAKYPSMPSAAVQTGLVDYVLSPERMPAQLLSYASQTDHKTQVLFNSDVAEFGENLENIFQALRSGTGHDFSSYKRSTILRRIQRRMSIRHVERLADYASLVSDSHEEVKTLLDELLIGVTRFFRDPEAFEALKQHALIPYLKDLPDGQSVRVWVPGCSGGEEPYSIAITVQECLDELQRDLRLQVFATDIDTYAIEKARAGVYPQTIADDVSPERLKKFFTKEDQTYRVKADLRQKLVFAPQNVIKDPPFTKVDLLVCRNLLIYFDTDLQKRLLPVFHYSLQPGGILFLGTSETVGGYMDYFSVVDKKWKIFNRRDLPATGPPPLAFTAVRSLLTKTELEPPKTIALTLSRLVDRTLIARFAPPCAVVDANGNVKYIHGRTGTFLEPAAGPTNMNVVEMAREGLKLPLSSAIRKAGQYNSEIKLEGLRVKSNGDYVTVDVTVRPFAAGDAHDHLMITFERSAPVIKSTDSVHSKKVKHDRYLQDMELELKHAKEQLQTTIEEMETSNEELRSINEEYQSTNEELQSTNEELNTSREELQSLNEELETVNAEYQQQIQQLQSEYLEMHDLIETLQLPTVVLNTDLRIKRFTSSVTRLINFIPSDVGRQFSDIAHQFKYSNLVQNVTEVLASLAITTVEVETLDGQWFSAVIRPLRSSVHTIGGVTISFFDITRQKEIERQLAAVNQRLSWEHIQMESIIDTLREGVLILNDKLEVRIANRVFYDLFHTTPDSTEGRQIYELGNRQWDIPQFRHLLEELLKKNDLVHDYKVTHSFPRIGTRTMLLNARPLTEDDGERSILLVIEDVTEKAGTAQDEQTS